MENVYIMGAVRTAIGKYGGSLKSVPAHQLGALVVREALNRSGVADDLVDEVILGEVRQSTEASNIARCVALEAGLPETVPGCAPPPCRPPCAAARKSGAVRRTPLWPAAPRT